jgi:hypothetical protein
MKRFLVAIAPVAALLATICPSSSAFAEADPFEEALRPALQKHCAGCHGRDKTKGGIDLHSLSSPEAFLKNPKLLATLVSVIDSAEMPPEDEPPLPESLRSALLATLRSLLSRATADLPFPQEKIRRLNRFQYNNAVRDLFEISRDIFALPEKLMTRHDSYLANHRGSMPSTLAVSCESFRDGRGFRGIDAFPKDLRAAHGFDNQANHLTLSPVLLDAYIKLSVSIVESPDFNADTVGVWKTFFAEPAPGADIRTEIRQRLHPFLYRAFRGNSGEASLTRYTDFAMAHLTRGASFTEAMKKVSSAVLCSPLFLFQYVDHTAAKSQFVLASKLALLLWGSAPDTELLDLAAGGHLRAPASLEHTLQRMWSDRKIERFLDSFPSQWLQLENILGAAPDRQKYRFYSLDPTLPAAAHMVLEPLLLFDAVFVENRRIRDLIAPEFHYRSDFLNEWYHSDFRMKFDASRITADNVTSDESRANMSQKLASIQSQRAALLEQIQTRSPSMSRSGGSSETGERDGFRALKPFAAWDFNGDLRDSVGALDLQAHGDFEFREGMVVLHNSHLESKPLPFELKARTMEVWIRPGDLNGVSGSVMAIHAPVNRFDSIAFGQRPPNRWFTHSENSLRSRIFEGAPEKSGNALVHLMAVYREDGKTTLYRNGVGYGAPYIKGHLVAPKDKASVLFGRNTPTDKSAFFHELCIDKARLYDRALTAEEVTAAYSGAETATRLEVLSKSMSPEEVRKKCLLDEAAAAVQQSLKSIPPFRDPVAAFEGAQKEFDARILALQRSRAFYRTTDSDARFGGIVTNAAVLTMTSGPKRTLPIARGSWMIEVVFNDPPAPPPNNVPPLSENSDDRNLTIREQFAKHRENPDCASCHSRLDPLGFALENFDATGRWRERYENGRPVDPSGTLLRRNSFKDILEFKTHLLSQEKRFARAFAAHLLRFALARELSPADSPSLDRILQNTGADGFRLRDLLREVIFSESFLRATDAAAQMR